MTAPRGRGAVTTVRVYGDLDSQTFDVPGQQAAVTLTLADGRTVQVGLDADGRVSLRAWAADPYAVNNIDSCSVQFLLPTLEGMLLDGEKVTDTQFTTHPLTERSLARPEDGSGTWHMASQATQQRIEGLRTLLALRTTPGTTDTPTETR